MKSQFKITSLCVFAIITHNYATVNISIKEALTRNIISTTVTCKGGLCLNYQIKNKINDSLKIIMPSGWRMNAMDEKYQDILVTREQILALGKNQNKSFEIRGYCCEYTNSGPTKGLKYESGNLAEPSLYSLANYLNVNKIDDNTEQYAVWAISNKRPTNNITCKHDSLAQGLRNFVANLKGEPLPWYTLRKKAAFDMYGYLEEYPIQLNANIDYQVKNHCYAYFYVLDHAGNKVGEIIGQWLLPGSHSYAIHLNIKGFAKGKYQLLLKSDSEEFIAKEFEI